MNTACSTPYASPNTILETAKYFFDTKGFDHTSIRDITEYLGIQEELLFNHFKSLDDMLEVIWSES